MNTKDPEKNLNKISDLCNFFNTMATNLNSAKNANLTLNGEHSLHYMYVQTLGLKIEHKSLIA